MSERLRQQKLELPPQNVLRQQVLERLVLQEIQLQRANHAGVKVSDETAERRAAGRREAQRPDALAAAGRARQAGRRLRRLPRGHAQGDHADAAAPARRAAAHQRHAARDRPVPREAGKARPPSATSTTSRTSSSRSARRPARRSSTQAAKRAQEVYTRAKGGEDFAKLAVAYSNSQTALDGGALGWRKGSELPTFLTDVDREAQSPAR